MSIELLDTGDRWSWYAYDYGFRRIILGDYTKVSPIDTAGAWFDDSLVSAAERFYKLMFDRATVKKAYAAPLTVDQDVIRPNWRQIRANDLTDAERAEAAPFIERLSQRLRANLDEIARRMKRPGADLYHRPAAREIVTMPLVPEDDPRAQEIMRKMEP